jgi:presenilin-like A22 family membrane protease
MIAIAVILVAWGAIRADTPFARRVQEAAGGQTEIQWQGAVAFVIGASVSLLLIFYFLKQMQILLTITISFASTVAVAMFVYSLIEGLGSRYTSLQQTYNVPYCGDVSQMELIALVVALVVVITWFFTRHWVFNDIIGASLCLYMLSMLQLTSIKVSALLLILLFFYDIFWVFYSSRIFGQSVMVAAATGLDLPIKLILPRILTPCLESNHTMLGLGDIALPGLLVAFTRRFDSWKHSRTRCPGYFHLCTVGYAVGMCICFFVLFVFKAAQPALLYLVPCTLGPVCLAGWRNGELGELWEGISNIAQMQEDEAALTPASADEEAGLCHPAATEGDLSDHEQNPLDESEHNPLDESEEAALVKGE